VSHGPPDPPVPPPLFYRRRCGRSATAVWPRFCRRRVRTPFFKVWASISESLYKRAAPAGLWTRPVQTRWFRAHLTPAPDAQRLKDLNRESTDGQSKLDWVVTFIGTHRSTVQCSTKASFPSNKTATNTFFPNPPIKASPRRGQFLLDFCCSTTHGEEDCQEDRLKIDQWIWCLMLSLLSYSSCCDMLCCCWLLSLCPLHLLLFSLL
jgi:hypothetical protein